MKRDQAPRYEWVEAWGERVKEERTNRNMSADDLARRVEVSRTTIFRIEKGELNPNEALKARIAYVFGIRMDKLWVYPSAVPPWIGASSEPVAADLAADGQVLAQQTSSRQ